MPKTSELDILQARGGHCGNGHLTSSGIAVSKAQHPIWLAGRRINSAYYMSMKMFFSFLTIHRFYSGEKAKRKMLLPGKRKELCQWNVTAQHPKKNCHQFKGKRDTSFALPIQLFHSSARSRPHTFDISTHQQLYSCYGLVAMFS